MNLYSKRQKWKLLLAIFAAVIVLLSLWYSNQLVQEIARDERNKIRLWAEAIEQKTELVNYTIELFDKLGIEEEKKVKLWAQATEYLGNPNYIEDYTFILQVVQYNTTVPVITIDQHGFIKDYRNLGREYDLNNPEDSTSLQERFELMKDKNQPIEITILGEEKNFLYYDESTIITNLRSVLDDLVQSFISEIVVNSASVPVIITDSSQAQVLEYGQVDSTKIDDSSYVQALIEEMALQNEPIEVKLGNNNVNFIFYKDSALLTKLIFYPYIQFGIIGLFLIIAYYMFSSSRKAEQNQVWVGMAKETAHQLGTPLSSLIAWMEYLRTKNIEESTISEISKDLTRLEMITERFSKIGSKSKLEDENLVECAEEIIGYLKRRISDNVEFSVISEPKGPIIAKLNHALFGWVMENIIKNAVDAMEGQGRITVKIQDQEKRVIMDIMDTGKGIRKQDRKNVFEPGFTTKKRGWGLGLSLVKRIVENYHNGKVFVKDTDKSIGTTFRIILPK